MQDHFESVLDGFETLRVCLSKKQFSNGQQHSLYLLDKPVPLFMLEKRLQAGPNGRWSSGLVRTFKRLLTEPLKRLP